MSTFQEILRGLLADRNGPESRALFLTLTKYVEGRVRWFGRMRASDLFGEAELEELVADVMYQLMTGSLAQFRGNSLPELLAFTRTITDRSLWRSARRRLGERDALELELQSATPYEALGGPAEDNVLFDSDGALEAKDRDYLEALFAAGSKAAYARQVGVSRAAVTKRVDRIRARIAALPFGQRQAAEAWLHHAARAAVS